MFAAGVARFGNARRREELVVSWILSGAIFGSVGVAFIASIIADSGGARRGDPDIGSMLLLLAVTTVSGAIDGGMLARKVRDRFAEDKRTLDRFALFPLLAAAILLGYAMLKP